MSEKILVTGGAGFIGSHLIETLLEKDNEIVVLDNLNTGCLDNLSTNLEKIEYVKGDIRDKEIVYKALDNVTKVYHLAAEVGVDRSIKVPAAVTIDINLNGTKKVLETCIDSDVNTLLFASSSEVYGHIPKDKLPIAEDDNFKPDTVYGESKLRAEKLCKQFSDEFGLNTISVRYFNVYGPRQSLNGYAVPHFINKALRNENIKIHGNGKQIRDFTFVEDAVDATVRACNKKYDKEVFNIGSGIPVVIEDLAEKIIELCDADSRIEYISLRRPTDTYDKYAEPSKIKTLTGWNPKVGLEEGLKRTIEYYKNKVI